jgi:hypothetical protein
LHYSANTKISPLHFCGRRQWPLLIANWRVALLRQQLLLLLLSQPSETVTGVASDQPFVKVFTSVC